MKTPRETASAILLSTALFAAPALADGQYAMYDGANGYMGDFNIIEDVATPGGPYVWIEMPDQEMWLYFPPEAIYVDMHPTNPIIFNQIPFDGDWVGTSPYDQTCPTGPNYDHMGQPRAAHGSAMLINTAVQGTDLLFEVWISSCGGDLQFFGHHQPAFGHQSSGGGFQQGGGGKSVTK
ncbi:hypothetical protein SAMN06273572_101294 [Monaibacterium marinum]|uniref:Uncharacterized protein n=1 Tax=Pontivivens marinum TaxID=1690039 RepID=A0A2C9CML2_9RHOB|nr:hypothetical protein [Monaibacterium marinum]SOH92447.1 hypothetical protein SAMN06273572_101294 [Monaibacterium marinum]